MKKYEYSLREAFYRYNTSKLIDYNNLVRAFKFIGAPEYRLEFLDYIYLQMKIKSKDATQHSFKVENVLTHFLKKFDEIESFNPKSRTEKTKDDSEEKEGSEEEEDDGYFVDDEDEEEEDD